MGKVLFLGVEGSGKSCLTASLVGYFAARQSLGWSLQPVNKEAFTFSLRMPKRFAAGELPAQTARFRHLQWSLQYKGETQRTLDVLDYPGEVYRLAFLDAADDPDPQTLLAKQAAHADEIKELMAHLKDADQIFVLFNIDDTHDLETNDANVDAVWVTVQTLKILAKLENAPQVTLLVTQADRLAAEGEDLSNIDALIDRHVPIVGSCLKTVNRLLVSALDAENAQYGLLPLARLLVERTEQYKKGVVKWRDILERMNSGKMFSKEDAKACEFVALLTPEGNALFEPDGELSQYLAWEQKMTAICTSKFSYEEKKQQLLALDVSKVPNSVQLRLKFHLSELRLLEKAEKEKAQYLEFCQMVDNISNAKESRRKRLKKLESLRTEKLTTDKETYLDKGKYLAEQINKVFCEIDIVVLLWVSAILIVMVVLFVILMW